VPQTIKSTANAGSCYLIMMGKEKKMARRIRNKYDHNTSLWHCPNARRSK